jgi:hypothetical protein
MNELSILPKRINVARVADILGGLALLKFFPSDPRAQTQLLALVCQMIESEEQAEWLVRIALNTWNEWEGPRELRALFCTKYRPRDGVEAFITASLSQGNSFWDAECQLFRWRSTGIAKTWEECTPEEREKLPGHMNPGLRM